MKNYNFGIFILSFGRPNNVITLKTLKKCGYNGRWWIVLSDDDSKIDEYKKQYGKEKILIFSKSEIAKEFDEADNFGDRRSVVYARNSCWKFAKELGLEYFLELDDDYTSFLYRYEKDGKLKSKNVSKFDKVCSLFCDFLNKTNAETIAFMQGGDLLGGVKGGFLKGQKRKAMNSFFLKTKNKFYFLGRINEDVNTYLTLGKVGKIFLTQKNIALTQKQTQSNKGGMTDIYLSEGTYYKSFYSIMFCPSCVKIKMMGASHKRMHHSINWNNAVPKILDERYKK